MRIRNAYILTTLLILGASCSKVGYVPLSEIPVSKDLQQQQRESKKFMKKDNKPSNSRLPDGRKFMSKNNRPSNTKLPEGDKLQNVKLKMSKSQKRQEKHFKKKKQGELP